MINQKGQSISGHQVNIGGSGRIDHVGDIFNYGEGALLPPPPLQSVLAYLKSVPEAVNEQVARERAAKAGSDPDALVRLWQQAFKAHPPNSNLPEPLEEAVYQRFERTSALGQIERVVILADAGKGKTPALKRLRAKQKERTLRRWVEEGATETAEWDDQMRREFVIPLFVDLTLASNMTLESLIADAFNELTQADTEAIEQIGERHVPGLLRQYRCLLLLDGLDVLISDRDSSGVARVRHFMDLYRQENHQYVITCRVASYRDQLGMADVLFLHDLTVDQARAVLREEYDRLNSSLQELVLNRAMLDLILVIQQSQGEGESSQPLQLHNKGHMLSWHMEKRLADHFGEDAPNLPLVRGVLEHLAYAMHSDHTLDYSERQVMEVIHSYLNSWRETMPWREMLRTLKEIPMLERDQRQQWRFGSDRDQAFWAARAIRRRAEWVDLLLDEADDYWWRETLDILVGLIPDPNDFFFVLMDRSPLAAADCIQGAGPSVSSQVTNAVIDSLVEAMIQESSLRRKQIVEKMAESTHPQVVEALFLALHRDWSSLSLKAIAQALVSRTQMALERSKEKQAGEAAEQGRPKLEEYLASQERPALARLRHESRPLASLVAIYMEASTEAAWASGRDELVSILMNRKEPAKKRGLAAIYLGLLASGKDEECWEPLIARLAELPKETLVSWCVVEALTECPAPFAQKVEAWACSVCQDRRYQEERRAQAAYLLGWISRHEQTLPVLLDVLQDENPLVRGFAVDALARLNCPEAQALIHSLLLEKGERHPDVLRRAAEGLGQVGTVESIRLLERYLQHERYKTRRAMFKAIADIRQRYGLWQRSPRGNYWT